MAQYNSQIDLDTLKRCINSNDLFSFIKVVILDKGLRSLHQEKTAGEKLCALFAFIYCQVDPNYALIDLNMGNTNPDKFKDTIQSTVSYLESYTPEENVPVKLPPNPNQTPMMGMQIVMKALDNLLVKYYDYESQADQSGDQTKQAPQKNIESPQTFDFSTSAATNPFASNVETSRWYGGSQPDRSVGFQSGGGYSNAYQDGDYVPEFGAGYQNSQDQGYSGFGSDQGYGDQTQGDFGQSQRYGGQSSNNVGFGQNYGGSNRGGFGMGRGGSRGGRGRGGFGFGQGFGGQRGQQQGRDPPRSTGYSNTVQSIFKGSKSKEQQGGVFGQGHKSRVHWDDQQGSSETSQSGSTNWGTPNKPTGQHAGKGTYWM